eukprot:TRINITY_DN97608_c0_g1_i1.p1 TRINITY_DN97608_c0_g1~~TRINITY_DN97608_c0_g1_i1.p1  ORF type:complete len:106 (+),score=18.00 TRINITY_DN97608_c0_g1_i1:55-372(+)
MGSGASTGGAKADIQEKNDHAAASHPAPNDAKIGLPSVVEQEQQHRVKHEPNEVEPKGRKQPGIGVLCEFRPGGWYRPFGSGDNDWIKWAKNVEEYSTSTTSDED